MMPKAAPAIFPYPNHRTMAEVMHGVRKAFPMRSTYSVVDPRAERFSWIATFEKEAV